jgi:hypothetical protein
MHVAASDPDLTIAAIQSKWRFRELCLQLPEIFLALNHVNGVNILHIGKHIDVWPTPNRDLALRQISLEGYAQSAKDSIYHN